MEEDGTWKLAALKLPESGSPDHLRLSLSSINSKTSTLSPTFAGSGLDKLMLTTQQAKLKQLKRVQLLKSQTQQNAETMDKQQRKDAFEELRAYEAQARIHKQRAERLAREAEVEARRQEIAAEAERRTELLKEHLIIKVGSSEQKAEMILRQRAQEAEEVRLRKMEEVRSRQEVLNKNSQALADQRQQRLAQKEAAAEAARSRIEQQKARAETENRARALQAETERLQALEAAEQESQARYEYYQAKVDAKEEFLSKMREDQASVRAARLEEARLREEYARRRQELKLKRDEVLKEELARKVEEKNDKMTAIEEQRRALMAELDKARKEIAAHDGMLRETAAKMKYEGKYTVTPDIEALEQKYAQEIDQLRISTPLRTPTRYSGGLSRKSSIASFSQAARRSSDIKKSVAEFALEDLEQE